MIQEQYPNKVAPHLNTVAIKTMKTEQRITLKMIANKTKSICNKINN